MSEVENRLECFADRVERLEGAVKTLMDEVRCSNWVNRCRNWVHQGSESGPVYELDGSTSSRTSNAPGSGERLPKTEENYESRQVAQAL